MAKSILFIYYQNIKAGGVSKVLANLANELSANGYTVEILFLMREHADFYHLDHRIKKHYINSFDYWTFRICNFNRKHLRFIPKLSNINNYIYLYGVSRLINRWVNHHHKKYDTIISCWYNLSCMLALNKNVNHKTIAWEHTSHEVGGKLWNYLRKYYRDLKQIVCLNSKDASFFADKNQNTINIPNLMDPGIEAQRWIPEEYKENLITMVARLDADKNVMAFLQILRELQLPSNWSVKIIGDGPEKTSLQMYIDQNKMHDVQLLGQLDSDEVRNILSRSKINCLTSLREGFGVVLVESLFCSNALIAYDCPSGPAEIVNENNGFLIPIHDKIQFEKKLTDLISHPILLEKLRRSAYEDTIRFQKDKILERWKEIL